MASLAVFARRIRALARRMPDNVDKIVKQAAIAVDQAVVLATPVDTGRARGGWQVGLGGPSTEDLGLLDQSGAAAIARNNGAILTRRLGQDIFISNNVEYIGFLNEGSSSQAPAGFVELAVQAGVAAVKSGRALK